MHGMSLLSRTTRNSSSDCTATVPVFICTHALADASTLSQKILARVVVLALRNLRLPLITTPAVFTSPLSVNSPGCLLEYLCGSVHVLRACMKACLACVKGIADHKRSDKCVMIMRGRGVVT